MNEKVMRGLDMNKIIEKLVECLEEQEKVNIEYVLEKKTEEKTA